MSPSPSRSLWSRALDVVSLAATPLRPSDYLELVAPSRAGRGIHARIESVWDETEDARTLTLRPGRGWRAHVPGQFVRLGAVIGGRIVTRTYSIASTPERKDGCITVTVKAVAGGKMSRYLVRDAKPGDTLTLAPSQGEFVLPEAPPLPLLLVTAGSGITPVMSMLRTFVARGAMPDVAHVHYAPRARDAIFGAELARIASEHPSYRLALVTTREAGARPRLGPASLDALVPDWRAREAWACGPEGLLEAVSGCFTGAGRAERLHVERFRPKLAPADPSAAGGRVRFGRSRVEVEAAGLVPLLHVAEGAGIPAPHGCRMGICHSCDVTMVSGCVRDLRTGRRIDEPGARVQVCVCAAAGDVELAL